LYRDSFKGVQQFSFSLPPHQLLDLHANIVVAVVIGNAQRVEVFLHWSGCVYVQKDGIGKGLLDVVGVNDFADNFFDVGIRMG